jgi:hypothetical protein
VTDPAGPRTDRDRWKALDRRRRRALEVRGASPTTDDEAVALIGRGRYLRSWRGAAEWALGGTLGVGLAVLLQYLLTSEVPWTWQQPVLFALVFVAVGVALRRWRGRQLIDRGEHALASDDPAAGREFGGGAAGD